MLLTSTVLALAFANQVSAFWALPLLAWQRSAAFVATASD